MARALELAERGAETTQPNPRVGCVIARDGEILAEGWHERAGGPHAEVAALRALAASAGPAAAAGSTVYVTLEPCSHYGRTPPCADALVSARVGRVVFAIPDPNPKVAGCGAVILTQAGIDVDLGLMEAEAEELNVGFLKRNRAGRPFVRVKVGMSLDGRTALANGASRWITSDEAREDVQRWRAQSAAVLTGIGTVLADDPQLNVRREGDVRQPLVVVLDAKLRTPPTARLLAGGGQVLLFTASEDDGAISALQQKGARIEAVSIVSGGAVRDASAGVDLDAVLARLGELEINEVLVEAGPKLTGALLQAGLVDELLLYVAPKLLGPQGRPLFDLPELQDLQHAKHFAIIEARRIGPDLRVRLRPD